MSREHKRLVIILEILFLGLLWQTVGSTLRQERLIIEEKIQQNDHLIKLSNERSLKRELNISYDSASPKKIQEEVINLYQHFDHQTDLYQRGTTLRDELLNCGLIPIQFKELQSEEGSFLEFTLTGKPENFLTFLENPLSPVKIFYFTLNAQRSSITMGIAPARLPDNISPPPGYADYIVTSAPPAGQKTPGELAALFYRPPVTINPVPAGPQITPVEQPLLKDRLSYIGRVKTKESGENYGFKEAATGKIILISLLETVNNQGWTLKGEDDERFLLAHDNNLYEVNR